MSRRSLAGALAIVALLLLTVGTGVVLLLRYEPRHHRNAEVPPGPARLEHSKLCLREFADLFSAVSSQEKWSQSFTFTEEQINSFLSEGFVHQGLAEKLLPEGITEPRVNFSPDIMRLSFRYRTKVLNTVISVDMRPWVTPTEGNVLALRLEGFQAGAVPFKAQWLLERVSEVARRHDIDISWYRHEGCPVAILRFQANQPRPTIKLRSVVVEQGQLTVYGESVEKTRTAMNVEPPAPRATP